MQERLPNENRDEPTIDCPVPDCPGSYESAQAVMAHVGAGHDDKWDAASRTPEEIHQEATANDTEAARRVGKVLAYLERNDVPVDGVQVYEHGRYGSIQVDTDRYLNPNEWAAFEAAVVDQDVFEYFGKNAILQREDVEKLPECTVADSCEWGDCDREETLAPVYSGGERLSLCRDHRKEAMGVSS